jgi:glycosyltransferase involved in cell wall biosynthesis
MRICLLSLTYPPTSMDGIPRQRQILATELARRGHDVHVVTCGAQTQTHHEAGVIVHQIALEPFEHYIDRLADLDDLLTRSQRLYEGLIAQAGLQPFDIVDVPMWMGQGFVTTHRYPGPTVIWLQTTYAQLLEINGSARSRVDQSVIDIERTCLLRADGILGDSHAALTAVARDYVSGLRAHQGMAYIGIPAIPDPPQRPARERVELLIVGRLERRKGTPLLLDILPRILRNQPDLSVRFVGRDNSASDGWFERHRATYAEVFRRNHPNLSAQVLFEGHVSEATLQQRYREADVLLVPSAYESFGIIYLEAMRVGLPVITFDSGGASEIFESGEIDGAILIRTGDRAQFSAAVARLASDANLRQQIGAAGLRRFTAAFTDIAMVDQTLHYYRGVIAAYVQRYPSLPVVFQVTSALYTGDAVSNIVRRHAAQLRELGHLEAVLASTWPPELDAEAAPLDRALEHRECALIFHYHGFSSAAWMIQSIRGRKAIYYHNITPASFFAPGSDMHDHLRSGYAQLRLIADRFDLIIGDSSYNIVELSRYLNEPKPSITIYPVVDTDDLLAAEYDASLLSELSAMPGAKLLFVGRIAPNKRQDQLMLLLDRYMQQIDPQAQLWLVGDTAFDPEYRAKMERIRGTLRSGSQIHLLGKVPDRMLHTYFRAADVFVCASEHEGFCVPIAQAMAFGLPVVALNATAVTETMGGAGVLVDRWEVDLIAPMIQQVIIDQDRRDQLIADQRRALKRFSIQEARARLAAVIRFLETGELSPLFQQTPARH